MFANYNDPGPVLFQRRPEPSAGSLSMVSKTATEIPKRCSRAAYRTILRGLKAPSSRADTGKCAFNEQPKLVNRRRIDVDEDTGPYQ
jgi:hypothetical protein